MSDLEKILLSSGLTALFGVLVFCIGQILVKFILDPITSFKAIIGKIDNKLKYYARDIFNDTSDEVRKNTGDLIRELSCDLESSYKQIPEFVRPYVKDKSLVARSARNLILISNAHGEVSNLDHMLKAAKEIRKDLNIPELNN